MKQKPDSSSIPSTWKEDALIDNAIAEAELAQGGACSVRMAKPRLYSYDKVQEMLNSILDKFNEPSVADHKINVNFSDLKSFINKLLSYNETN
jgi:hypothetical protein